MADIGITPLDLNLPNPGQSPNWAPQLNNEIEKLANWVTGAPLRNTFAPALVVCDTGTGNATVDTANVNAAIAAMPEGSTLVLHGEYHFNSPIINQGKSVTLDLTSARLVKSADVVMFNFTGAAQTIYHVISNLSPVNVAAEGSDTRPGIQFNVTGSPTWKRGDVIKMVSDDIYRGSRIGPGDGKEPRSGQFFTVHSVTGNTVVALGTRRETFTTNVRVTGLSSTRVRVVGGEFDIVDGGITAGWERALMMFNGLVQPVVSRSRIRRMSGFGFQFTGCYHYLVESPEFNFGLNDPSAGNFSYGIADVASWFGKVIAPHGQYLRHLWTDGAPWVASNASAVTHYGRTLGTHIIGGTAHNTSNTAWDTHSWSESVTFDGCTAFQCFNGFSLRGKGHRIIGGTATECRTGLWAITEATGESYGHEIDGLVINRPLAHGVVFDIRTHSAHPYKDVREARESYLRNVTVRGAKWSAVRIENATVRVDGLTIESPESLEASQEVVRLVNSVLSGPSFIDLDFLPLAAGSAVRVFALDDASRMDVDTIRYRIAPANAGVVERIFYCFGSANPNSIVRVNRCDVSHHPSGGSIHTQIGVDSKLSYVVRDNGRSSALNTFTNTQAGDGTMATNLARYIDPVLVARVTSAAAVTLAALERGYFDGQQLVIINRTTNGSVVTVPHGPTYRTDLKGEANVALNHRDSIRLVWIASNSVWSELA